MKKILILLSFLIPFLSQAQDSVWLYGSTANAKNKVIARNDFQINGTFYLGAKDTTFTPSKSGAWVVRPQDGKTYSFILNPGGKQWWPFGGFQNLYATNLMSAINDSTFGVGGTANQNTIFNLQNNFNLTIDSAFKKFKVNFGSDAPWDLFTKDSITGYWVRIPHGAVGTVLTVLSTGLGYTATSNGVTNLTSSTTADSVTVNSSTGNDVAIYGATSLNGGILTANTKKRIDSTVYPINPSGITGDSVFVGSLTRDTLYARRFLFGVGVGLSILDSSSVFQIYKTINIIDNGISYAKVQQVSANRILGNSSGSTQNVGEIGLGPGLGFVGGSIGLRIIVNNIANLGTYNTTGLTDSSIVIAGGYGVSNDGGGGSFLWSSISVATPVQGMIIQPTGITGAGRFIRMVQGEIHQARWFGVKADGITNDSLPISIGVNYLTTIGGGTLQLPADTMICRRILITGNNTRLIGSGALASVVIAPSTLKTAGIQMLGLAHRRNITVENIVFDASGYQGDLNGGNPVVLLTGDTNVVFRNVQLQNNTYHGFSSQNNNVDILYDHVRVINTDVGIEMIGNATGDKNVQILGGLIYGGTSDGVVAQGSNSTPPSGSKNISIIGLRVSHKMSGSGIYAKYCSNVEIIGCIIDSCAGGISGISAKNVDYPHDNTASENIISDITFDGIGALGNGSHVINNKLLRIGRQAITVGNPADTAHIDSLSVITGNTVNGANINMSPNYGGILVQNTFCPTIEHNTVLLGAGASATGTYGLKINGSGDTIATIAHNKFPDGQITSGNRRDSYIIFEGNYCKAINLVNAVIDSFVKKTVFINNSYGDSTLSIIQASPTGFLFGINSFKPRVVYPVGTSVPIRTLEGSFVNRVVTLVSKVNGNSILSGQGNIKLKNNQNISFDSSNYVTLWYDGINWVQTDGTQVSGQSSFTLTTIGSPAVATYINGVLNIPAPTIGTVTSVAQTVPTSLLSISGTPVTGAGTLAIGLAPAPAHGYWGNNLGSSGTPSYLTNTQLTADLNPFSSTLKGVVPASGGGTVNFLRADGSWSAPPGSINPFTDNAAIVKNNTDPTKQLILSAGSISTGVTRTWIFPDVNGTVARNDASQSFTGPQTFLSAPIFSTLTGMLKGNGASAVTVATAGTDYTAGTAALGTGILKNTTGTGAHSIAIASDFPIFNQNTTGTASNITGNIPESQVINLGADLAAKQAQLNGTGYIKNAGTTSVYQTGTQVTADLDPFTFSLKGLVPASGGGTANFLRADGSWSAPPSGNSSATTFTSTVISGANLSSSNFLSATYSKTDNVVHVRISGILTATAGGGTFTQFTCSIPFTPSANVNNAGFIMIKEGGGTNYTVGSADVTTSGNTVLITYLATKTTGSSFCIMLDYPF